MTNSTFLLNTYWKKQRQSKEPLDVLRMISKMTEFEIGKELANTIFFTGIGIAGIVSSAYVGISIIMRNMMND